MFLPNLNQLPVCFVGNFAKEYSRFDAWRMRIEFSSFTWVVTQNPACPFLTYRNQGASTGLTNCPTTTKMAFRRFLPMFDRVLVERVAAETVTKGGIMLPEKSMAKVLHATVVAVGPGSVNQKGNVLPVCVKVGEKVLLPEYGGTKVVLEDKDYFLFRDADILGKYVD